MERGIVTPLGEIQIYIDDVLSDYEYKAHFCNVRSVRAKPPAGCYRITISERNWRTIRCVVALKEPEIPNVPSSGQRYLCSEFVRDTIVLTIGAGDEMDAFDTNRLRYGVEYVRKGPVDQVEFGVAWAVDYDGQYDIRTQLATDLY